MAKNPPTIVAMATAKVAHSAGDMLDDRSGYKLDNATKA